MTTTVFAARIMFQIYLKDTKYKFLIEAETNIHVYTVYTSGIDDRRDPRMWLICMGKYALTRAPICTRYTHIFQQYQQMMVLFAESVFVFDDFSFSRFL